MAIACSADSYRDYSYNPEAWNRLGAITRREGEPFTASVDCPSCGDMDVHWLAEPRFRPDDPTPLDRMQQSVHSMQETLSMSGWRGASRARLYDSPGTVVARACKKCDYRWGQK